MSTNKELSLDIINRYKQKKQFLQVKDFISDFYHMLIMITYKGTGKSYSALYMCIENLVKKNWEFAWVRNTEIEVQNSKLEDSIMSMFDILGVRQNYKVKNNGIYQIDPNNKFDRGILRGVICYMSKPFNVASQNALNNVHFVVYDEFINPDFIKKNLFSNFLKLAHTLFRSIEGHIILLGNKHESNNDILAELGIEFDWEKNEDQLILRKQQSLAAFYLTKWDIKKMDKTNVLMEKFSMYSPSMRNFTSGNCSSNQMTSVKNWYINNIQDIFVPKFKYDLNETRYCVGICDDNGNYAVYIKQLDFSNEFPNIKTYCYKPQDKTSDNSYIPDIDDLVTVEFLIDSYSRGNLYFSTAFAKSEFKHLLMFLKLLLK